MSPRRRQTLIDQRSGHAINPFPGSRLGRFVGRCHLRHWMTNMAGYDCGMTVTSGKAEPGGLRDVTRRAVRAEIAAKAMDLFLEQGFEETTVNQVAAAVGMSSRSVFRYFDSKEEMVIGELVDLGHEVAAALEGRPDDEDPWIALRHALQVCVDSLEGQEAGRR